MTPSAPEIRRRITESVARLGKKREIYESEIADHTRLVMELQACCPHENVSEWSGQYTLEQTCCDCGKAWSV